MEVLASGENPVPGNVASGGPATRWANGPFIDRLKTGRSDDKFAKLSNDTLIGRQ
jgi:hypothetical protein